MKANPKCLCNTQEQLLSGHAHYSDFSQVVPNRKPKMCIDMYDVAHIGRTHKSSIDYSSILSHICLYSLCYGH